MEREQFTFYASFANAICRIKKKADRCEAYDAICRYALYGEKPDLENMADAAAITFDLIKPVLDTAKRKAENGKLGGSKKEAKGKQKESKEETSPKQTASDIEGEVEIENESYIPPVVPPCDFSPALAAALSDWLAYKKERRESYKTVGFNNLVAQLRKAAAEYGDEAVAEQVRNSIASRYQGITFDRLRRSATKPAPAYHDPDANLPRW